MKGFKYKFVYDHVPCQHPRTFTQLSYLVGDYYSDAEFIATIDSVRNLSFVSFSFYYIQKKDSVLYTPVLPSLLFNNGKVLLVIILNFCFFTFFFDL